MYDQILLDDPTLPGYQPALPDDFDIDEFAAQVKAEEDSKGGLFGRRPRPPRRE